MLERWNAPTHNVYPSFSPSVHCNFPIVKKRKHRLTEDEPHGTAMYDGLDADAGTGISHKRKIP